MRYAKNILLAAAVFFSFTIFSNQSVYAMGQTYTEVKVTQTNPQNQIIYQEIEKGTVKGSVRTPQNYFIKFFDYLNNKLHSLYTEIYNFVSGNRLLSAVSIEEYFYDDAGRVSQTVLDTYSISNGSEIWQSRLITTYLYVADTDRISDKYIVTYDVIDGDLVKTRDERQKFTYDDTGYVRKIASDFYEGSSNIPSYQMISEYQENGFRFSETKSNYNPTNGIFEKEYTNQYTEGGCSGATLQYSVVYTQHIYFTTSTHTWHIAKGQKYNAARVLVSNIAEEELDWVNGFKTITMSETAPNGKKIYSIYKNFRVDDNLPNSFLRVAEDFYTNGVLVRSHDETHYYSGNLNTLEDVFYGPNVTRYETLSYRDTSDRKLASTRTFIRDKTQLIETLLWIRYYDDPQSTPVSKQESTTYYSSEDFTGFNRIQKIDNIYKYNAVSGQYVIDRAETTNYHIDSLYGFSDQGYWQEVQYATQTWVYTLNHGFELYYPEETFSDMRLKKHIKTSTSTRDGVLVETTRREELYDVYGNGIQLLEHTESNFTGDLSVFETRTDYLTGEVFGEGRTYFGTSDILQSISHDYTNADEFTTSTFQGFDLDGNVIHYRLEHFTTGWSLLDSFSQEHTYELLNENYVLVSTHEILIDNVNPENSYDRIINYDNNQAPEPLISGMEFLDQKNGVLQQAQEKDARQTPDMIADEPHNLQPAA